MEIVHYPGLHEEVLANLPIKEGDSLMIDCTTGEGGHTSLFLSRYPDLKVIGLDRDRVIQQKAIERLRPFGSRFTPVLSSFDDYLESAAPDIADAILFDLGISMFHYVESERGFSFRRDEKLDMRLNPEEGISAADIVNGYQEEALADVIYRYGEERYSRRIARAIVARRQEKAIERSAELAEIIAGAVPREYRYGRIHPATRTFQALRIEVNGEKGTLVWKQEEPECVKIYLDGQPDRIYWRNNGITPNDGFLKDLPADLMAEPTIPSGHPEAFHDAYARLHRCFEADVRAYQAGKPFCCDGSKYANVMDGYIGMSFVNSCVDSSEADGAWKKVKTLD